MSKKQAPKNDMAHTGSYTLRADTDTVEDYDVGFDQYFQPAIADPRQCEFYRQNLLDWCTLHPGLMEKINAAGDPTYKGDRGKGRMAGIRTYLKQATLVLWNYNIWSTAVTGSETFNDQRVEPHLVNPPVQLWIPDRGVYLDPVNMVRLGTQGRNELIAMLVIEDHIAQQHGLLVTVPFFALSQDKQEHRDRINADHSLECPYFCMMLTELGKTTEYAWQWDVIAMLNFMRLQVTEVHQYKAPRPERRRAMKAGKTLPDIRVVQLRKVYHTYEPGEEKGATREFSCHWLVRGHWRQQWYPSLQQNKPKFVAPYVKGDSEKPFKAPSNPIYAVVK